jgi:cytochrome c oxidase subunit 2
MPLPRASGVGRKPLPLGLGLVVLSFLSGCAFTPQTTVMPKTEAARQIQDLYVLVFWLAVLVFIGTQGGLLYILWRFRARPGQELPQQTHGNTVLEVGWTIAPAIVLVIMAVPTIRTIFALETPPTVSANGGPPLEIEVVGKQWWWEYRYPESGIVTANEMVVPVGRTVVLKITSDNVIHSFWVPQLTGKIDAIPNHVNELWFTPEEAGQYFGQCAEYCGVQHAQMRMDVIAMSQTDYDAWVRQTSQPPAPLNTELVQAGSEAFSANGCAGCHSIAGTTAVGKVGPDLSHVGSRTMIAASIMPNTTDNLARWLRDPQEVKPGNAMPNLHLRPQDIDALVEYLHSLK